MSIGKRVLDFMHRLPNWVGDDFGRNLIRLEDQWPETLEIKLASTEKELEECFRLVHDRYVAEGVMEPQVSGLAVLPQHLLPQTSIVEARLSGRVVATAALIRDNPMGLPSDKLADLKPHRMNGVRVAEMSCVAISPDCLGDLSVVFLPLFRYIFQYAASCFNVQLLVLTSPPRGVGLYRSLFGFERIRPFHPAQLEVLELDLEQAPARWERIYGYKAADKNLLRYLLERPEHPGCKMPALPFPYREHWIMTPEMLERLFVRKTGILRRLKREEARAVYEAYPHDSIVSLIQRERWGETPPRRRELRTDIELQAQIDEPAGEAEVRNISRHGLRLWCKHALEPKQVIGLRVWVSPTEQAELRAQVRWKDAWGYYGLRILSYSGEWSRLIQSVEEQFEALVTNHFKATG